MRVDNKTGIENLCEVARHILNTMPVNAATKFAVRTVLREAVNKSNPEYRGNNNRKNCRHASASAVALLGDAGAALVSDHAIPVSLLLQEVHGRPGITLEELVGLVAKYSVMALITRAEDDRLAQAGLKKKMPGDWDGQDALARYKHAGIELGPNPLFQPDACGGGPLS